MDSSSPSKVVSMEEHLCGAVPDYVEEEEIDCQFSDIEDSEDKPEEEEEEVNEDDIETEVETDSDEEVESPANHDEIHPLNNPVVLTRMFELCPKDLLAKFRQVSKLWHQLSLQSWRASVTITFRSPDLRDKDNDFFWERPSCIPRPVPPKLSYPISHPPVLSTSHDIYSTTLQKFLYFVEEPSHDHILKPFRRFKLDEWEFRAWEEQIEIFMNLCGPFITVLELSDCFFHDLTIFRDVLFRWFPNLKYLVIKNVHCRWFVTPPIEPRKFIEPQYGLQKKLKYLEIDLNHEQLPISWLELFSHYPMLQTFKLYNADVDEAVEQMLNAIKIIRKHDPRKLQIKDLDLLAASLYAQDRITPEACLLIRDVQLPLESLTIDFGVDTETKKVQDILEWHAKTLIKLDAYRGPISFPYRNFPFGVQLDNLQELVMSDRLSESLTFMKYTPNLKKLYICDVVEDRPPIISTQIVENSDQLIMRDIKLEKCKELRFDYVIPVRETRILMDSLPNIEKVRMPMNPGQFRMACESWPNLRDFEVLGSMLDDEIMTGLSPEDVKAINSAEEKGCSAEITGGDDPLVSPVAIHPNITNLTHLRRFKMNNEDVLPTKLMDCSAFHGFLKLPHLQSLHITTQMNDRARNALLERIPDCTVVRIRRSVGLDWDMSSDSDSDW